MSTHFEQAIKQWRQRRYRIEAVEVTRLAGRHRYLQPGERALVPKTAVRFPSAT